MANKSYNIVQFRDVLPIIIESYYKDFPYARSKKIPVSISVSLRDDVHDAFTKDPSWMLRAQQKISEGIKKWLRLANEAAKNGADKFPEDQREAKYFLFLGKEMESMKKTFENAAQKECLGIIKQYTEEQDKLKEYRTKAAGKLAITGVSTACSVVLTVLTGGAAAPLFIIAVCRTAAGIVQECAKLASTVDTTAKYVTGELKILSAFMQDSNYKLFEAREKFFKYEIEYAETNAKYEQLKSRILELQQRIGKAGKTKDQDAKNKQKIEAARKDMEANSKERAALEKKMAALKKEQEKIEKSVNAPKGLFKKIFKSGRKSATELGLGALSGVVGLETPSLASCKSHIELHDTNIGKVSRLSHNLSTSLNDVMDKQKETLSGSAAAFATAKNDIKTKFAEIIKKNPANAVKIKAALNTALGQLDKAQKNYETGIKKIEGNLDKLIHDIIAANEKVDASQDLNAKFREALQLMHKGVPNALDYTATVISLGTGLAMGFGSGFGSSAVEIATTIGDTTQGLIAELKSIAIDEIG
jgi:predicted  nucleic acid-binding Zn-ribbon protein